MTFHIIIANFLIGASIAIMGGAIFRANQLLDILKGSKVVETWKKSRIALIVLTVMFVLIMITRLIGSNLAITDLIDDGPNHALVMNGAFLVTSILMVALVSLDIKAFSSLFALLKEEEEK